MRSKANFVGFEDPKYDLNSDKWMDRIRAMAHDHLDKWAKYGPYKSKKAAQNVASNVMVQFVKTELPDRFHLLHLVESDVDEGQDDEGKWFLFIRLVPVDYQEGRI